MDIEPDMGGVTVAIEAIAAAHNKIVAVRNVCTRLRCGVARSKELVEYVMKQYPHTYDHWEK